MQECRSLVKRTGLKILWLSACVGSNPISCIYFLHITRYIKDVFSFFLMTSMSSHLARAIEDVKVGKPVILVDSPDRENEGDFVVAAQYANTSNISFLFAYSSRMLCVPMLPERLEFLGLHPVTPQPTRRHACSFYTPVDPRSGNTGLGLEDRLLVIEGLLNDEVPVTHEHSRLAIPGHTFPLRVHPDGLLGRQGHTEGSVALMCFAGLYLGAVIAEVWNSEKHRPMDGKTVALFAREHQLSVVGIDELVAYQQSLPRTAKIS